MLPNENIIDILNVNSCIILRGNKNLAGEPD